MTTLDLDSWLEPGDLSDFHKTYSFTHNFNGGHVKKILTKL